MKKSVFSAILLVFALAASCGRMSEIVDTAHNNITKYLHGQKIYDPTNYPEVKPTEEKGHYQVVDGVYRYIVTLDSEGRDGWQEVRMGDVVSLKFDARVFSGSSFDRFPLFFSNNAATINYYASGNPEFDTSNWPTTPYIARIGGGQLMPAIETALISCRAGDKVQLFIPPDKAYGGKQNYTVPAYSTLAFEITIEGIQTASDHISEYLNALNIYDRAFAPLDAQGYYDRIGSTYRYVLNENREGRPAAEAASGDVVSYWFTARVFNTSIGNSAYFHTNIEDIKDIVATENPGHETEIDGWPTEPLSVVVGENKILINGEDSHNTILKALGTSLPTCRVGDKLWVFILPGAVGTEIPGGIAPPQGSTLMYELEITEISK